MEIRLLKLRQARPKVQKFEAVGLSENSESADGAQASLVGLKATIQFIDEEPIRGEFDGKGDCFRFTASSRASILFSG